MTARRNKSKKHAALRFGAHVETLATGLLRLKGYRILARQLRNPLGEIDIIARRGRTLIFVEVKARAKLGQALEALSRHQQKRIRQAATAFVSGQPRYATFDLRFDLIAAAPWCFPRHLKNAW